MPLRGFGDLARVIERLLDGSGPQGFAGHQLQHQAIGPGGFFQPVDCGYIGMVEGRQGTASRWKRDRLSASARTLAGGS